jgi:hypothetical protein
MAFTNPLQSTPLSAVEVKLTYGGDFELTPTGDLMIIQDTPYYPAATIQRVSFLILTNPAIPNINGVGTSAPDDIFHPDYGSGARAFVGRPSALANIDALQRNILQGLADDPFISQSPAPSVIFTQGSDPSQILVTVSFTTVSGQSVTIPDLQLGGSVV